MFNWDVNEQGIVTSYNLSAALGDVIVVEAYCSLMGMKSGTLKVGSSSNDSESSTPRFEAVILVGVVVFFFLA